MLTKTVSERNKMNLRKKLLDYQLKALVYMIPATVLVILWAWAINISSEIMFREIAKPFLVASL